MSLDPGVCALCSRSTQIKFGSRQITWKQSWVPARSRMNRAERVQETTPSSQALNTAGKRSREENEKPFSHRAARGVANWMRPLGETTRTARSPPRSVAAVRFDGSRLISLPLTTRLAAQSSRISGEPFAACPRFERHGDVGIFLLYEIADPLRDCGQSPGNHGAIQILPLPEQFLGSEIRPCASAGKPHAARRRLQMPGLRKRSGFAGRRSAAAREPSSTFPRPRRHRLAVNRSGDITDSLERRRWVGVRTIVSRRACYGDERRRYNPLWMTSASSSLSSQR